MDLKYKNDYAICPNCGNEVHTTSPNNSATAIIGMCISLFSFLLAMLPIYGFVSVIGVLLSVVGLIQIIQKKSKGYIFAIVGIVTGIPLVIFNIIWSMMIFEQKIKIKREQQTTAVLFLSKTTFSF